MGYIKRCCHKQTTSWMLKSPGLERLYFCFSFEGILIASLSLSHSLIQQKLFLSEWDSRCVFVAVGGGAVGVCGYKLFSDLKPLRGVWVPHLHIIPKKQAGGPAVGPTV